MRPLVLLLFSAVLLSTCSKEEINFFNYTTLYAHAGDQSTTLHFYYCREGSFGFGCATREEQATYTVFQATSPDGPFQEIADHVDRDSLVVSSLNNGQQYYFKMMVRLGRNIADTSNTITVIPQKFNKPTVIYSKALSSNPIAAVSPNGRYEIIFKSDSSGYNSYIVDIETQTEIGTFPYSDRIYWRDDSKKLLFMHFEQPNNVGINYTFQIYEFDTETKTSTKLTEAPQSYNMPRYSPDGQTIAVFSTVDNHTHYGIWLMNADGTQQRQCTPNFDVISDPSSGYYIDSYFGGLCWSSDAQYLYFSFFSNSSYLDGIYKVDIATGEYAPAMQNNGDAYYPAISPDNQQIAFVTRKSGREEVWVYNFATQQFKQVTSQLGGLSAILPNTLQWADNEHVLIMGWGPTMFKSLKIKV